MKSESSPEKSPRTVYSRLMQLDDVGVMRELQAGNDDALAVLYDRFYNAVLGVGLRVLRDRAEAEDILQNVFLEIANGVGKFDPSRGTVIGWILQCAYARCLNRRNYLLVRRFYANVAMSDLTEFEQGALGLYAQAPQECARFVREALALLSDPQRRTIEMVHFEGLDLKDVSVRTEQTFSNTRHHYYRGMAKLKEHLRSVRGKFQVNDRQQVSRLGGARVDA